MIGHQRFLCKCGKKLNLVSLYLSVIFPTTRHSLKCPTWNQASMLKNDFPGILQSFNLVDENISNMEQLRACGVRRIPGQVHRLSRWEDTAVQYLLASILAQTVLHGGPPIPGQIIWQSSHLFSTAHSKEVATYITQGARRNECLDEASSSHSFRGHSRLRTTQTQKPSLVPRSQTKHNEGKMVGKWMELDHSQVNNIKLVWHKVLTSAVALFWWIKA